MKKLAFLLGVGLAPWIAGCSSHSATADAPVGPNPVRPATGETVGGLQVFSRVVDRNDDRNQGGNGASEWPQHTDYTICNLKGKTLKHVSNATGQYATAPARVALAPGKYLVKAQAKDYLRVDVPVRIERGRTTRVHLDDNWKPPAGMPKGDLVTLPDGRPVGWIESAKEADF